MAGLPVWGAKKRCIEKQRDGRGSELRWPPFDDGIQQSTRMGKINNGDVRAEARGRESAWGDTVPSFGTSN